MTSNLESMDAEPLQIEAGAVTPFVTGGSTCSAALKPELPTAKLVGEPSSIGLLASPDCECLRAPWPDGGWRRYRACEQSHRAPRVSVVIPTYNEAANLPHVFALMPEDVFEVIVVDGRSTDGTIEVARALRPDVRIVRQNRRGKGNAMACGFAEARGDVVVMLDADGSADPREIPRFVEALVGGADFAKGTRFAEGGGSSDITATRRWGNRMLNRAANVLFNTRYTDLCYGYNALWTHCLPVLELDASGDARDRKLWGDGFEIEAIINTRIAKARLSIVEVPSYEFDRIHGESNLNTWRDGVRVLRALLVERASRRGRRAPCPGRHALPVPSVSDTSQARADFLSSTSVSIVIPCYTEKRWERLTAAIDSALSQTCRADVIVVVDNNQDLFDKLQEYYSQATDDSSLTVLPNDRARGASGARNTGAMTARSDLVAFLDDDAWAEPTWLAEVVSVFDDKAVLGAGGAIEPTWETRCPPWFPHEFGWVVGVTTVADDPLPRRVRNLWACNMVVRRDEFVQVNGFRETFGKLNDRSEPEDTDLCIRVSAVSPERYWVQIGGGRVHHQVPAERSTVPFFFKRCWNEGVGKANLVAVSDKRSEALSSERDYLRSVLPRGVYRHLRASARGDVAGLARAGFIAGGALSTCLGFASAKVVSQTVSREPDASVSYSQPGQLRVPAACPVLMYHSIPAETDRTRDPWWVPLDELRSHLVALVNDGWTLLGLTDALAALQEDPTHRVVALTFDDGYIDFMGAVDVLESVGARATLYVPTAHIDAAGIKDDSPAVTLSWSQLAEVAARGVEIGSHAHHHRPVDILPSVALRDELRRSKAEIEAHVRRAVHSFCFPHGYTSRRVRAVLVESGYTNACIVGRRVTAAGDDVFSLPRLQVSPGTSDKELMTLMKFGEPGWTPVIKRVLQPAWRLTRLSANRVLHGEFT